MDIKTLAQMMAWLALDGLAALWALHAVMGMMGGSQFADAFLTFASALCG